MTQQILSRVGGALSVAAIFAATGCGDAPASTDRFTAECTRFCENRFDCFGDPEGRRANCGSSCEGAEPAAGACEEAAVAWASCLAALTCTQLSEVGVPEAYCGTQRATYDAECTMTVDGGTG